MLKGYWSKKNSRQATFQDAQNFCQSLGKEWSLPTAYQLISLISPDFDSDQGYIAPIFSDNDQENFWSSSREAGETNTWYISFEAGIIDQINPIFSTQKLQSRCFRPE